jgi:uncharacterized protein involved in oxidation of intracellular sulfur
MTTLFIVNHPPYGTEYAFNAFRLANVLAGREGQTVRIFLQGDAAACAKSGQEVPKGFYNLERMLKIACAKGIEVGVCSTCMDARGLRDEELSEGLRRSTLEELADWTAGADKVLVF